MVDHAHVPGIHDVGLAVLLVDGEVFSRPFPRYVRDWQIVAKVQSCDGEGNAVLTLNNKFSVGDALELVGGRSQCLPFGWR